MEILKEEQLRARFRALRGSLILVFKHIQYGNTTIIPLYGDLYHIKNGWITINRGDAIKHENLGISHYSESILILEDENLKEQLQKANKKYKVLLIEKESLEKRLKRISTNFVKKLQ